MKVSRKHLNKIIESYIFEVSRNIPSETINLEFDNSLEIIKKEIMSKAPGIPQTVVDKVVKAMDATSLYIVPVDDEIYNNPETSRYEGYALHVKFDKEGNPESEELNLNILKDEKLQQKYKESAVLNPVVVIFEKNVKNKRQLRRLLLHELGHIKNNFIKILVGVHLNVVEVRNILRDDLKDKSPQQMMKIFKNEGFIKDVAPIGMMSLIKRYKEYYDGVFSEPPDELSVDEFAVRISALQRDDVAQANISMGEQKTFNELEKRYGVDIAGLALFLKKDFVEAEVDAIVQNIVQKDSTNV